MKVDSIVKAAVGQVNKIATGNLLKKQAVRGFG
jgi:hypothetical protein